MEQEILRKSNMIEPAQGQNESNKVAHLIRSLSGSYRAIHDTVAASPSWGAA